MVGLARFVTRHAALVVVLVLAVTAAAAAGLPPDYDDDVVRFLPADDPEVVAFHSIMERFGGLDVALVGVETDDLYTHDRLAAVRELVEALDGLDVVEHVTAITELAIIEGEDEAEHKALVPNPVPKDPEGLAAVRQRILGLDYIAGTLASVDGRSAMLVVQTRGAIAGARVSTKRAAEEIRAAAEAVAIPDDVTLHFGGAPFIAEAAANGSQDDLARLAPYVVLAILVLILLTLGSIRAALLTVGVVLIGIIWTLGLMGWVGQPLTLVSSALPVILVALGSAYAVHLLVWYQEHDADVSDMLHHMGWPVVVTGLTTVAGFLSFMVMDLAPMREFGWQMAIGTAVCAGVSLLIIPAVLHLLPLPPRKISRAGQKFDTALARMALGAQRHRWRVLAPVLAVAGLFACQLADIETRMDTSSFFAEGSAPALADRFMVDEFGGSVFLQLLVSGDLKEPALLHRMAAFEDRLRAIEGVTRVDSISKVMAIVHEGLKKTRQLSRTRKEIEHFGFLARRTDPAIRLLVDDAWGGALMQVGIGGFDTGVVGPVTEKIRALADGHLRGRVAEVPRSAGGLDAVARDAAERVAGLTGASAAAVHAALIRAPAVDRARLRAAVAEVLEREIVEDEMVEITEAEALGPLAERLAADAAALTLTPERFVAAVIPLSTADERDDPAALEKGARYVYTKVDEATRPLITGPVVASVTTLTGPQVEAVRLRVAAIVDEVMRPTWYLAAEGEAGVAVAATVSGYPILQEAMTRSVQRNQVFSLLASLPMVLLIMCIVFRSVVAGLLGIIPTALTLLVTFGLMGLFPKELPLDIGASMLASIALGVGIDYAIHFMWRYRNGGLEKAMATTGRSISINAAEITAGFIILAWATIIPMSRFGLLTAQTLLVAALATLVLLPTMLDLWIPRPEPALVATPGAES